MDKFAYFDFAWTICPLYFVSEFNQAFSKEVRTELKNFAISQQKLINEDKSLTYNEVVGIVNNVLSKLLEGQRVDYITEYVGKLFKGCKPYEYVSPLFQYLYKKGFNVEIITADCDFMIGSILRKLPQGFKLKSSLMGIENGKFTGKIKRLLNDKVKVDVIKEIETSSKNVLTIAFGDSQGDIPMLERANLGFFIKPDRQFFKDKQDLKDIVHIDNPDSKSSTDYIIKRIEELL